jgi:uncharacterized membrane protein
LVPVLLAATVAFLFSGYLFKSRCIGDFNAHSYKDLCYNDIQPLFGIRLFRDDRGAPEKTFPYVNGRLVDGELRDGAIEYPVLTGVFMWATGSPVDDADSYLRLSAIALAPFGLLIAYLLVRMARVRAFLWSAAPALVLYAFHNWDLLVVAASVTGIWLWWKRKFGWAAVLFGLGAALKMYPIMFLAPLVLDRLWERDVRGAVRSALAGLGTVILVNLPFTVANFDGWIATYRFHEQRYPNFDSIWWLGWPNWSPERFNLVTLVLTALFAIGCIAAALVKTRRDEKFPFIQLCAALLATFLLWNKVHSPQYTLWLLPFFVLLRVHIALWLAYAVADLAVYVGVFRYFYDYGFQRFDSVAKDVMTVGVWSRAALLLLLIVVFLTSKDALGREDRGPEEIASHPPASLSTA